MRAVDTNVLVRLITRDDSQQVATAEVFIEKGVWVSTVALVETIWVLRAIYNLTPENQVAAVEMMLNHPNLALQDMECVATALALFRSKPTLGFSDCLILELARKAGHLPLGTFDQNLAKVPGTQRL
jgi:predicted nucleic-acid-binding protein